MVALIPRRQAAPGVGGINWTTVTTMVMFTLTCFTGRTGRVPVRPPLAREARVPFLNELLGRWWADSVVGFVIVYDAVRDAIRLSLPRQVQP